MWLKSLKHHFTKKRTQQEAACSSLTGDDDEAGELVHPVPVEDEEYNSRPKRRSVSIDIGGPRHEPRTVVERRTSLEQWHEARRARNSMEGQGTTTTDRLTVCKAGTTTIVNKTYITIKHLGSGTFGRVMLCFNVYDQRLYAIKVCRKSQFAQLTHSISRYNSNRLRRASNYTSSVQSPSISSACFTARSCAMGMGGGGGGGGGTFSAGPAAGGGSFSGPVGGAGRGGGGVPAGACISGPLPPVNSSCAVSSQTRVANICATSATADVSNMAAAAAAAAALVLGSGSNGTACGFGMGGWPAGMSAGWGNQGQLMPPMMPTQLEQQPTVLPQDQLQQQQQQLKAATAMPLRQLPNAAAVEQMQRRGPHNLPSCGGGGHGGMLLSSGSAGWGGGVMGTDCSTGSMSGGSVFQEALMRFQTEEMVKEIAILKKLNHPNIVNLVEVIDDPSTDSLLLVMEYVEGGTLEPRQLGGSKWEPLAEKDVWRHVREVLQGMDYLHHHKVVHGDLKPANLLLDSNSNKVKIADFGSSIMCGSDKIFSMRNCPGFSTPAFRSPESLTSGYQPSYEMDMWALGVCIYMWVYGSLPFTGVAPFIIYEKIRAQDITLPPAPDASPELKDFISGLLDKDVLKRLDVVGAMTHPWVTLGGSAPLATCRQQTLAASMTTPSLALEGVVVSQEDIDAAIRQIGSSTSEQMDVVFEEVHLQQGQELISAGEVADRIYLIAAGEVEIIQGGADPVSGHEPLISGLEVDLGDPQDSDMWDNTHVSDLSKSPGTTSMMLLSDVLAPWDSSSSHAGGGSMAGGAKVLAVKGPGDSLGVPLVSRASIGSRTSFSHSQERHWKVSVRARGAVTLFRAKLEDLEKLVEAHPEMASAVKQIVTQQETDMMVAEAMRQLRLYNDVAHTRMPDVVMAAS